MAMVMVTAWGDTKTGLFAGLGVDCIWLLPIYPSPLKDDGYDISDYYKFTNSMAHWTTKRIPVAKAHKRGIRVIMDLVLNHTSDQHPWFQAAAQTEIPLSGLLRVERYGSKIREARIIFIDTEPSNWTWDEQAGQYFWHRFYSSSLI